MSTSTIDIRLIPTIQYVTPTTGQTVTTNTSGNVTMLINPAGTLLALTISLNGSPTDGDTLTIASSQIITTLTLSGGTVISPLTTLAVGTFATYMYSLNSSNWFRVS